MRKTENHHDCAKDGTCGQFISDFKIGNADISFFDSSEKLIAKVPKLPKYSSSKYGHRLYKEAESKQCSTNIHDVLPNSFVVEHGYIRCTIKYDNLSKQEQSQIETDIKTAYEAFKEKFCLKDGNASNNITVYIFNNRSDYTKYNDLLGVDADGGPGYIIRGVTDYRKILTYKQDSMDFVLGHKLGHILQMCFAPAEKVQGLYSRDTEFIANVIGREVEEKNCKAEAIRKQKEYEDFRLGFEFTFKYKGTIYKVEHKNYLDGFLNGISKEERVQFIKDIKNSHESLISECNRLGGKSAILQINIYVDENKDIEEISFCDPDKQISKWLDKTLISRGKSEEKVKKSNTEVEKSNTEEENEVIINKEEQEKSNEIDHANPKPKKELEPKKESEPEKELEESSSNFLSNIIFSAVEHVIGSISSFFSWLFGSEEKESSDQQLDDNFSLLELDANELDYDVRANPPDEFM